MVRRGRFVAMMAFVAAVASTLLVGTPALAASPSVPSPALVAAATQTRVAISRVTVARVGAQAYTGKAVKPTPRLTYGSRTLRAGTDYTLSYRNNVNVGTATIVITGKGRYGGRRTVAFKIAKRSVARATVSRIPNKYYTGSDIRPKPKVTYGKATLKLGTHYSLFYANNRRVGTATITIRGKGLYAGTKKITFRIVKRRLPAPGVSSGGALSVKGSKLVDSSGKAIQLRGVSTHGLAWFPDYVNDTCFKQLHESWGANVVRLALYSTEYGGYCSGGNKRNLKNLVKKGVRYATAHDMYAIVDWHILSDANPLTHEKEAKEFFADISSTFANSDNVIYEICNEPNGSTAWNAIKSYANRLIPVIRANDPDAIIIVGTPTWSQEVDKALASPLKQKNVMYSLHFYAATHKDDLRNRMVDAVRGGLPVFVTEFGICDASGNGTIDQRSANSWMSTMDSLGVSWCMWSLCNKAESASALKSSCTKTSGFATKDLSTAGVWLLRALGGSLPAGTVAQGIQTQSGGQGGATTQGGDSYTPPAVESSESVSFVSGGLSCTLTPGSYWSQDGKVCYQYELTVTNQGPACDSWRVEIPFSRSIELLSSWSGAFKVGEGNTLVVSNVDYNGHIGEGESLSGIGFQLTSASGLVAVARKATAVAAVNGANATTDVVPASEDSLSGDVVPDGEAAEATDTEPAAITDGEPVATTDATPVVDEQPAIESVEPEGA